MMRGFCLLPCLVLSAILAGVSGVPAEAAERGSADEGLGLLRTRNIFDPTRRPDRPAENRREREPAARAETLNLIGTMLHEGRAFAFFDGSNASYRQVLSRGDTIASMQVGDITTAGVELAEAEGTVHWLPVGSRLRRVGTGAWSVTDGSSRASEETRADGGESGARSPERAVTPGTGSENDDILRRMMERRRLEESR